jgi:hypothetical protein
MKNALSKIAVVAALALLGSPAMRAQTLSFVVDINTAGLAAQDGANAPFYLDFDFNYGNSSLATNTATLSGFTLSGGSAVGSTTTTGSATGNLGSTVTLTASSANPTNELYQQFTAGTTNIQFTASITEHGPDIGAPTEFATSILDNSLGIPAQLFTTAPDTASLVTLTLNSANTISNVNAYTSVSSADGNTPVSGVTASITAIPEPPTTAALLGGIAVLLVLYVRRHGPSTAS